LRLAIFSDIHGNIEALKEVFKDIGRENVDEIYCLGDLVGYGPHPNQVINLIRELNIETVMGNYDRGVGFDLDDCGCAYKTEEEKRLGDKSIKWTRQEVTESNKYFLRNLKENIRLRVERQEILLVHGSPRKINQYLFFNHPYSSLKKMLDQYEADIIVCGHTHIPYIRQIGNKMVINDGSVGKQKPHNKGQNIYSREAKYLILEIGKDSVNTSIRSVRYDFEKTAEKIKKSGLPDQFAEIIRGGI